MRYNYGRFTCSLRSHIEAVETVKGCDGCFFDERNGCCVEISLGMECSPKYRSDGKNIIYKEVKE